MVVEVRRRHQLKSCRLLRLSRRADGKQASSTSGRAQGVEVRAGRGQCTYAAIASLSLLALLTLLQSIIFVSLPLAILSFVLNVNQNKQF
jgi:hypothetical protein